MKQSLNPFPAIRAMNRHQWNLFWHGYFAWTIDSFDFFCVSVSASDIAETLNTSLVSVTWGLTLVLMLRTIGALIFGYFADRWGRKWPLIGCYTAFIVLEIATGFVKNLHQFLAVRSLFGIAMGGCWGLAAATSFEDAPLISRGFLSGIYQPGYAFGFVLATAFYRAFIDTKYGWKALFWFSALPPLLLLLWRISFGELDYYKEQKEARAKLNLRIKESNKAKELGLDTESYHKVELHTFSHELRETLKTEWPILIYLIILLSVFNFLSHGSMDLFPTFLAKQRLFSENARTVTNIVVNLGGLFGGPIWGQLSEILGRRLAMTGALICVGIFLYPTFFLTSQSAIMGSGFMLQFSVMGAWGIVPIHLTELTATTPLRTFIAGTAYQIGNLASSASSTIEAELGKDFPLEAGEDIYNYGKVMAIFIGAVVVTLILSLFFGPERYHHTLKNDFMLVEEDVEEVYDLPTEQEKSESTTSE